MWKIGLWTLFVLVAPFAGRAHHSGAMFDQGQIRELTGVVRQFQWTNPHCYIQLVVKNSRGEDEDWSIEMAAPMHLYGQGWRPTTVRPGDRIKVKIRPLRNGEKGGEIEDATTLDGKPLGKQS